MSLIVNCGFYEPTQNEVAIKMARLFAKRAGFDFASSFSIASGKRPRERSSAISFIGGFGASAVG